jgi:hypothetical protein
MQSAASVTAPKVFRHAEQSSHPSEPEGWGTPKSRSRAP